MEPSETIEEFNRRQSCGSPYDDVRAGVREETGQFNLFRIEPITPDQQKPAPYKLRDFFKIMLIRGKNQVHYADKVVQVTRQALTFFNPQIPYRWEHTGPVSGGFFCIFNTQFFSPFGSLNQYNVFQPTGEHVFELTDEQVHEVTQLYERMFAEIDSDYRHKYDVLRNLVFELLHYAMKMQPLSVFDKQPVNAAQRISALFMELLERQFPIDDFHRQVQFRQASDFAGQLNVHVNHLNRAVKETTQQTTTQLIAGRVLQEAKILLKQSNWPVSDIAHALGFTEVTHFNNFFKKYVQMSPLTFRKGQMAVN